MEHPPIPSRHGLWLRLRRYLIVFDPLTFVLDQWKHPWQMLSQWFVFRWSENFTSLDGIRVPLTVPVNHYFGVRNQQNSTKVLFHYPMLIHARASCLLETLWFFQSKRSVSHARSAKSRRSLRKEGRAGQCIPIGRPVGPPRNPTTSVLTATTLIYAIGAGITAAAGTRLALQLILDKRFKLFSFQLPEQYTPALLFIVTTSLY